MIEFTLRNVYSLRWNGSNGAEMAALYQLQGTPYVWTVESQGADLKLRATAPDTSFEIWTVPASNPWVVVSRDYQGILGVLTDAEYEAQYTAGSEAIGGLVGMDEVPDTLLADQDFVDALIDQVPVPTLHVAVGRAALPALLLGGTTSLVVTFDEAMPNTGYALKWRAIAGAAVLSQIVANGAVTKTTTQVTIPLRAQGLASVAGVLLVEAYLLA